MALCSSLSYNAYDELFARCPPRESSFKLDFMIIWENYHNLTISRFSIYELNVRESRPSAAQALFVTILGF